MPGRVEQPVKYAVATTVSMNLAGLEYDGWVVEHTQAELRERLARDLERLGREPCGPVITNSHEDVMHAEVRYVMTVLTRERTDGEWASVWQAVHEDEQDRRAERGD